MGTVRLLSQEFGLQWYDKSNLASEYKVQEAIWQFQELMGTEPTQCIVNSASGLKNNTVLFGVRILVKDRMVDPHVYWLLTE